LAGAVRAEQGNYLAWRDDQVDPLYSPDLPEALMHAAQVDGRLRAHFRPVLACAGGRHGLHSGIANSYDRPTVLPHRYSSVPPSVGDGERRDAEAHPGLECAHAETAVQSGSTLGGYGEFD